LLFPNVQIVSFSCLPFKDHLKDNWEFWAEKTTTNRKTAQVQIGFELIFQNENKEFM